MFEGVLLIDKPQGITSHDVVYHVRKALKMKKVGHAGTLDPMATGLMIILLGKGTKASQYLMGLPKEYTATLLLGQETDSQDADGEIIAEKPIPELTDEAINAALKEFIGDQYQTPPMFSAKKIDGVPLYKHARKGKTVEREPRFINISKFDLLKFERPNIDFHVACSKGTYIRTIGHDLAQNLGTCGHLTALRRTQIGQFSINQAITLDALKKLDTAQVQGHIIPTYKAVPSMLQ